MGAKRRIYISDRAYLRLKEMSIKNKEKLGSKGMCGMLDILLLGETTTKGSGRPKKGLC